jgi:hypothetical protein
MRELAIFVAGIVCSTHGLEAEDLSRTAEAQALRLDDPSSELSPPAFE